MIKILAIVFEGGLGTTLYDDGTIANPDLVWPMISALESFTVHTLEKKADGFSEIKVGSLRMIVYNPFKETEYFTGDIPFNFIAVVDIYDNIYVTINKMKEIHEKLLKYGLGSERPYLEFTRAFSDKKKEKMIKEIAKKIAIRTQILPQKAIDKVNQLLTEFIHNRHNFKTLVIMLRDIDGGLLTHKTADDFVEDISFTDQILSNIIAENPSDADQVWMEKAAPDWISEKSIRSKEVFIMTPLGKKSDFRLLARIVFKPGLQSFVKSDIKKLEEKLTTILKDYIIDIEK